MRIYLTFFKFLSFAAFLTTASVQASLEEASKLAHSLNSRDKVTLATKILLDVLHNGEHDSEYRASLLQATIEQISRGLNALLNPTADAERTPSAKFRTGSKMAQYGKIGAEKKSIADDFEEEFPLFADKEYRNQTQTIYIQTPLNLQIIPLDFKDKKIAGKDISLTFIKKNKENIKKLIRIFIRYSSEFYIGRVNAPDGSIQTLGKRCSQHAVAYKKQFWGRKVTAMMTSFSEGHPHFSQPLAINLHPDDVNLIEGHLIQFFPWLSLQNSIKGETAKKGEKPDAAMAKKLQDLFDEFYDEVLKEENQEGSETSPDSDDTVSESEVEDKEKIYRGKRKQASSSRGAKRARVSIRKIR